MNLCGSSQEHCCWFQGTVCRFLEESAEDGFKWSCSLRRELGEWEKVHKDPRYVEFIRPEWDKMPHDSKINCGDWPPPGMICSDCGNNG